MKRVRTSHKTNDPDHQFLPDSTQLSFPDVYHQTVVFFYSSAGNWRRANCPKANVPDLISQNFFFSGFFFRETGLGRGLHSFSVVLIIVFWRIVFPGKIKGGADFPSFHFSVEPSDTVVVRNEPAILHCSADGPGPPKIKWKRDGEFLDFPDFNDRR